MVAPGGHILGLMDGSNHQIALDHPAFVEPTHQEYYTISGTSQAAAVVTGTVALILQADPERHDHQRLGEHATPALQRAKARS